MIYAPSVDRWTYNGHTAALDDSNRLLIEIPLASTHALGREELLEYLRYCFPMCRNDVLA